MKINWDPAQTGDFSFENTIIAGYPTSVTLNIHTRLEASGNDKVEIWMWDSVNDWEKVGEVLPDESNTIYNIPIMDKFDTFAKINEAKMRLKYVEVP